MRVNFYLDTFSNMSGHVGCAPDSDRNCAAMQQVATGHDQTCTGSQLISVNVMAFGLFDSSQHEGFIHHQ